MPYSKVTKLSAHDYATMPSLWRQYETVVRRRFDTAPIESSTTTRDRLKQSLREVLGAFPARRVPLEPVLLESFDEPDYRVEKVVFQSEPGLFVPCYVLTPRDAEPPYRPVIALHGHGAGGASHLIGRIVNEATRDAENTHIRAHNYDYARQLARQGFFVLAPEQRGFGERMESQPELVDGAPSSMWRSSCPALALSALLLGKTAVGLRVWDVMIAIDYLRSRPEPLVDGVGCLGFSGGGMTAMFSAALDTRITVAVISGCLSTFRASLMATVHCPCQYIPGIAQVADMADIAGMIAPRPLLVESGERDTVFPISAAREAYAALQRHYDLQHAPELLAQDFHPDGHRFSGRRVCEWLATWL